MADGTSGRGRSWIRRTLAIGGRIVMVLGRLVTLLVALLVLLGILRLLGVR